jgi:hypothetical protein
MERIEKTKYIIPNTKVLEFDIKSQLLAGSDLNGSAGAGVDDPGDGGDINMGKEHGIWDDIDWNF